LGSRQKENKCSEKQHSPFRETADRLRVLKAGSMKQFSRQAEEVYNKIFNYNIEDFTHIFPQKLVILRFCLIVK